MLEQGKSIKENLLKLKEEIKAEKSEGVRSRDALAYHFAGKSMLLAGFLKNEDPKIRKNTALILGEIGDKNDVELLLDAYECEETMYVRNAYLSSAMQLGCEDSCERLRGFKMALDKLDMTPENRKHLLETKKLLADMTQEKIHHRFTGYNITNELVLMTNRNYKELTIQALGKMHHREFNAGVMVKTDRLQDVLDCRLYEELLFVGEGLRSCDADAADAGRQLVEGGLYDFLCERHEGGGAFHFRLEIKSRQPGGNVKFLKQLATVIEEKSDFKLLNSTGNYEFELRLVERSTGGYSVLIKLMTLPDKRFEYRREVIAACMKPYNAALTMAIAKPYLRETASVLDPFCGVATMLVERALAQKTEVMYGIDIFGEAIEKSKKNVSRLKLDTRLYFINRDFFEFKHDHMFDEIITDMPFQMDRNRQDEIESLYEEFFAKAPGMMNIGGIMVLYSHNRAFVGKNLKRYTTLKILKECEISKHEGTYVYIIERVGGGEE